MANDQAGMNANAFVLLGEGDLISDTIRTQGCWAPLETKLVSALLDGECGAVIYDVGAYLGTFSVGIQLPADSKIVAIEPTERVFPILQQNLAANLNVEHVAINAATGSHQRWARIDKSISSEGNTGGTRYQTEDNILRFPNAISKIPLKSIRYEHGDYTFLKLDVEGSELETLLGDVEYIKHELPCLWVECNEDERVFDVFGLMKWCGYQVFFLSFAAYNTPEQIKKMGYACEATLYCTRDRSKLERILNSVGGDDVVVTPLVAAEDLRRALWLTPRWLDYDWCDYSRQQMAGLAFRLATGQKYENFLSGKRKQFSEMRSGH